MDNFSTFTVTWQDSANHKSIWPIRGEGGWRYRSNVTWHIAASTQQEEQVYLVFYSAVLPIISNDINHINWDIKITLFDYGSLINTTDDAALPFQDPDPNASLDGYLSASSAAPAMSKTLLNSYPALQTGESLKYLFRKDGDVFIQGAGGTLTDYKKMRPYAVSFWNSYDYYYTGYESMRFTLSHDGDLFQKDEYGYYVYDCAENAAYYNQDTNRFELYDALIGTGFCFDKEVDAETNADAWWNFLPFDQPALEADRQNIQTHPVSGKDVYFTGYSTYGAVENMTNLWFGMTMEFDFYMPKDGLVNGEQMVFEFSGDDDVWVYLDDVLILDIGGCHSKLNGSINFATGEVNDPTGSGTLKSRFEDAQAENSAVNLDGFNTTAGTDKSQDTFANYTKHSLKFFYMDRAAGNSYCKLKFNMTPLPTGAMCIANQTENINPNIKDPTTYTFKLLDENGDPYVGRTYTITDSDGNVIATDQKTGEDGSFTLEAGQTATFTDMLVTEKFRFEEVQPETANGATSWQVNDGDQTPGNVTDILEVGETTQQLNISFTHTIIDPETLVISKKMLGTGRTDADYSFTLSFNGSPYTGELTLSDSTVIQAQNGNFTLKANQSATIMQIPADTTYSLSEADPSVDGYTYFPPLCNDLEWAFDTPATYTIIDGENAITFTNRCNALLTIAVTGVQSSDHHSKNDPVGNEERQSFIFHIAGPDDLNMDVTVCGNSSVTIVDLPLGIYSVTEDEGWSWRYTADSATQIVNLGATGSQTVTFANTRDKSQWLSGSSRYDQQSASSITIFTLITTVKDDESEELAIAGGQISYV